MNTAQRTKQVPLTGPDDERHGTNNCYVYWKCRCDRCKAAHAAVARTARGLNPPARCPVCSGASSEPPIIKIEGGIGHAWYIDAAGHGWETRWAADQ